MLLLLLRLKVAYFFVQFLIILNIWLIYTYIRTYIYMNYSKKCYSQLANANISIR